MRRISLLILSGVLLVMMISCKPDKSYKVTWAGQWFIQTDSILNGDTIPLFAPYFTIQSNRMLSSYSLWCVSYDALGIEADTLYFPLLWQSVTNTGVYTYYSNFSSTGYPHMTVDRVTTGPYTITGYSTSGQSFTNTLYFNDVVIDEENLLGPVKLTRCQYIAGTALSLYCERVANAYMYVFVVSTNEAPDYRFLLDNDMTDNSGYDTDDMLVRTSQLNYYEDGTKFTVRIGAVDKCMRILRESRGVTITVGEDYSEYY